MQRLHSRQPRDRHRDPGSPAAEDGYRRARNRRATLSPVAWSTKRWPTSPAGARIAAAHAGRPHHAHVRRRPIFASSASSASAPASAQLRESQTRIVSRGRSRSSPSLTTSKWRVEGRHLVDFGHGDAHLVGERLQEPGRQALLVILNEVEIFDQQVALARLRPEDRGDRVALLRLEHPAFWEEGRASAAGARRHGSRLGRR